MNVKEKLNEVKTEVREYWAENKWNYIFYGAGLAIGLGYGIYAGQRTVVPLTTWKARKIVKTTFSGIPKGTEVGLSASWFRPLKTEELGELGKAMIASGESPSRKHYRCLLIGEPIK